MRHLVNRMSTFYEVRNATRVLLLYNIEHRPTQCIGGRFYGIGPRNACCDWLLGLLDKVSMHIAYTNADIRDKRSKAFTTTSNLHSLVIGIVTRLGNFLKPLATINLPKSPTFLGIFCKGVKIYLCSSVINLGNFYRHLAIFFWSHWLWLKSFMTEAIFLLFQYQAFFTILYY